MTGGEEVRTNEVLDEVLAERVRQVGKWGGSEADGIENPSQSNYVRLRTLAEEFGEVAEVMGRPEDGNGTHDLRTELIQLAAVAAAWVEGGSRMVHTSGPKSHRAPVRIVDAAPAARSPEPGLVSTP